MRHFQFLQDASGMFVATLLANVFNLLYQLFMVRALVPVDFGTLNALLALITVIAMPTGTLQTVTTKFISTFKADEHDWKISNFLWLFSQKLIIFGAIFGVIIAVFSRQLAIFFKIEGPGLLVVLGLIVIMSTILPFLIGALQGLQRFVPFGAASIINGGVRLAGGVILVTIGWRVAGALWAIVLGSAAAAIVAIIGLRSYFFAPHEPDAISLRGADIMSIYKFFLPTMIGLASFALLTNMDIILVKRFFSAEETGYYSIAQIVGKIILFLPGAVTIVMFPKLAENYARKADTLGMLKFSLLSVGVLCGAAGVFCVLFPHFVLKVLAGSVFPQCIPLILPFAVSMSFFALNQVFLFYHFSVHNTRFILLFLGVMVAQIVLMGFFHAQLLHIVNVLIMCAAGLLCLNMLSLRRAAPA